MPVSRCALPLLIALLMPHSIGSGHAPAHAVAMAALQGQQPVLAPLPPATATYTNPVIDRDLPDPALLYADGAYWMTHTTGGPKFGWPLYRSADMIQWKFDRHLLDSNPEPGALNNKPEWMEHSFWAPEIHRIGSRYLLTFTAFHRGTKRLCIGIASADRITGPFTVAPKPLVQDTVAVLDSHLFQDTDGRVYLLWKRDADKSPKGGVGGALFLRELDVRRMSFASGSAPAKILESSESTKDSAAGWEKGLVEAPWMLKRGNYYYLFYSGAFFVDNTYSVGVARATSLAGPFERCPGNPILRSNSWWIGPGHGAFVQDAAGVDWHLYHARHQDKPQYGRVQLLDRLYWTNEWPAFGTGGTPSTEPQPVPRLFGSGSAMR